MFTYRVEISQYCEHSEHTNEVYGAWHESYSNSFQNVRPVNIREVGDYRTVSSTLDIKPGEKCFVVWVEYSTGDSFGHADRARVEPLAIFKDREAADQFAEIVKNAERGTDNGFVIKEDWTLSFKTKDGQNHKIYAGWSGYFETLDAVNINTTTMVEY